MPDIDRPRRVMDLLSERDPWITRAQALPPASAAMAVEDRVPESAAGDAEELTPEMLEELRQSLYAAPHQTLLDAPAILGSKPTIDESMQLIEQAEEALRNEAETVAILEALVANDETYELPEQYQFPGYDPDEIPITPYVHKFEDKADWKGWAVTGAEAWVWRRRHTKPPFPRHSPASPFIYPLNPGPNGLQVALFSDAANGYYHSRYIMKHIAMVQPAAAIHLGDVYYTGRQFELDRYLEAPLQRLLTTTPCFVMNANHEMDHYGVAYFDFVRRKNIQGQQPGFVPQVQEGSYFCLETERYQIIGLDTAYFANGRHTDPECQAWLADRLESGHAAGRINILLSQNEPYDKGSQEPMPLIARDLHDVKHLIDIWFWGDEHYTALYGPGAQTPFIGSCIGHAGFPYYTLPPGGAATPVAPTWWEETGTRFPEELNVRPDMGLNGWCLLGLGDDALTLTYYDWLQRVRNTERFQIANGQLLRG